MVKLCSVLEEISSSSDCQLRNRSVCCRYVSRRIKLFIFDRVFRESVCSFRKCSNASGRFIFFVARSSPSFGAAMPPRDRRYLSVGPSSSVIWARASIQASYTATRQLFPRGGTQKLYCFSLPPVFLSFTRPVCQRPLVFVAIIRQDFCLVRKNRSTFFYTAQPFLL